MSVATLKGLVRTWRTHPVTHGKLASAVARFLRWQIASRIHGGKLVFPFVEPTRLMAARAVFAEFYVAGWSTINADAATSQ